MEIVNEKGVQYIQFIQEILEPYESTLLSISQLGDPGYAFTVLFPIIASFNTYLAAEFLIVDMLTEWANTVLKWLLMEDRPYWWVRETKVYSKLTFPKLKQTPLTCETGPGSPSGHVMGTAALLYVLIKFFIGHYNLRIISESRKRTAKMVFWFIYIGFLIAVATSRLYVATHFPHQCVLGAICGIFLASLLTNNENKFSKFLKTSGKIKLLFATAAMIIISVLTYYLLKLLGIDPQWSVKLAFKWCERPENIHVNTTPIYSLSRDIGIATGLALIAPINDFIEVNTQDNNTKSPVLRNQMIQVTGVLLSCALIHIAQSFIPTNDVYIFYLCQFSIHVIQPILLLKIVPFMSKKNKIKVQ